MLKNSQIPHFICVFIYSLLVEIWLVQLIELFYLYIVTKINDSVTWLEFSTKVWSSFERLNTLFLLSLDSVPEMYSCSILVGTWFQLKTDTLWIMGLTNEFNEGRKWVKENFKFNSKTDVSVFETVIRFVGGFIAGISCY